MGAAAAVFMLVTMARGRWSSIQRFHRRPLLPSPSIIPRRLPGAAGDFHRRRRHPLRPPPLPPRPWRAPAQGYCPNRSTRSKRRPAGSQTSTEGEWEVCELVQGGQTEAEGVRGHERVRGREGRARPPSGHRQTDGHGRRRARAQSVRAAGKATVCPQPHQDTPQRARRLSGVWGMRPLVPPQPWQTQRPHRPPPPPSCPPPLPEMVPGLVPLDVPVRSRDCLAATAALY